MRRVIGDGVSEDVARAWRRLEAAGAPAAIDVKSPDRRLGEDRRAVRRDIDDAAPGAQHLHAREHREHLADGVERVVDDVQAAGLGIGGVLVGAGADHQFALVGLGNVGVYGVGHHHAGETRLDRLGDQRLQREAFERHADACHLHQHRGVTGGNDADLLRADRAASGLDARHCAVCSAVDADHLAVLDDVDAHGVRLAGIAPGDCVMACRAALALQRRAHDRIAGGF